MNAAQKLSLSALALGAIAAGCASPLPPKIELEPERPNFLVIVADDQRFDTMEYMPRTQERIFNQGVTFDNAYVTTARCSPSRASILTGMYAHNHNVRLNSDPFDQETIVQNLDEAGYYTGLVGKYVNTYPASPEDPPLPEFDYWIGMTSGPDSAAYYDPTLNVNGTATPHTGYQTDILRDYAVKFIDQASQQDDPFFLMFTPYAPHLPARPAPGDDQLYPDLPPHEPPNFNPADMSGKPQWMQELSFLAPDQIESINRDRKHQLQTLNALDIAVETLLDELADQGELDNTVIFYISDNGLFLGEHRLPIGKIYAYEESARVPFAVRYPPLAAEPRRDETVVANIDIAPTIYDLAGLPPPDFVDGMSLRPFLQNDPNPEWRDYTLIEGWPTNVAYVGSSPPFQTIRAGQYEYTETEGDLAELYDLAVDPYQLQNQIASPDYTAILEQFQAYLTDARKTIPAP
ncbi:MAG: sulfatase [Chloroflexi bacterium]|nr:sulfatase [Chloroflexota bacterium]